MINRVLILTLCFSHLAIAACIGSPNCTVKAAGGGNYTTISGCAAAAVAGDTCTVFAGTYNETVTLSQNGTPGNPITFTVNSGDTVQTYPWTIQANYITVNGFLVTDSAGTHGNYGIEIANANNHITISNNTITQVGPGNTAGGPCIETHGGSPPSFVTISGNTVSWCNARPGAANGNFQAATGIETNGDHFVVKANSVSHTTNGFSGSEDHTMFIGNSWGPVNDPVDFPLCNETGNPNCDTHADMIETFQAGTTNCCILLEGNHENGIFGVGGAHMGGGNPISTSSQGIIISRFNTQYNVGSGYLSTNFNDGNGTNFNNWKDYNNTLILNQVQNSGGTGTSFVAGINSTNNGFQNDIILNGDAPRGSSGIQYYLAETGATFRFTGNNLMYDSLCSPATLAHCTSGLPSTDPGNSWQDPQLVATDGTNFSLQSTSPARNIGAVLSSLKLTSVTSATGSGTSLTVTDAGYFQDGWGLSGVSADCIAIGSKSNHTCITNVNYSTNTLTVSPSISWNNGDPVFLYSRADGSVVWVDTMPTTGAIPFAGASPPTLSTTTASNIAPTSASSGGTISSDGGATISAVGICYAITSNPTSPCTSDSVPNPDTNPFTSNISGLSQGTTYHYRAFATNSAGTSYGSDQTFTTGTIPLNAIPSGAGIHSGLH